MKNKITKSLATAALLNFISLPAFSAQDHIENAESFVQQAQYKNVATIKRNFAKQVALNY